MIYCAFIFHCTLSNRLIMLLCDLYWISNDDKLIANS